MGALGRVAVGIVALACASAAGADAGHEPYLKGAVVARVPGQNAAQVSLRWNFSCLAGEYGDGTYVYTIVLRRLEPKPETATPLRRGSDRTGTFTVQLKPGRYRVDADPYRCEAGVGLSSNAPEIGSPFVVPDFCTFVTERLAGRVTAAGRVVGANERVRPGNVVVVPKKGMLQLFDEAGSEIELGGPARAQLDKGACATTPGWRWSLAAGTLRAASPAAAAPYEVLSRGVLVSGDRSSTWTTTVATGGKTTVTVQRGRASVKAHGKTTTLTRGRMLTVS